MLKCCWLLLLIFSMPVLANSWQGEFNDKTHFSVCFTPGGRCTDMIVNAIDHAQKTIEVQAYSFTSAPIIRALIAAKQRGIAIDVLLDKSNVNQTYSAIHDLESNDIPFLVDYKPAIAHNKVMIIDDRTVITGSFNFTKSAQARNAENALIITSSILANDYEQNFMQRKRASISLALYKMKRTQKQYRRHARRRKKHYRSRY